jgi:Transposase/Transposase IS116/IS110/IS902 family
MVTVKVLGLDVSKSSVSLCLLTSKPESVRQFYYNYDFVDVPANKTGIEILLGLKPDIAICEPTGTNYSRLWCEHLVRAGVEVCLVGHQELRYYRQHHLNLPDKDDHADAFALACYWFDHHESVSRFVLQGTVESERMRELILLLQHLNRIQSPVINRLRQELSWQFPEVAQVDSKRGKKGLAPLLWAWIAKERESKKYDAMYSNSVGHGLNQTVRARSAIICALQKQEFEVEAELVGLLKSSCFTPYCKVFQEFGFGLRTSATLLSYIYPVDKFFGGGNQPEVEVSRGRISGKPTKKHLSLRRFQKFLGLAPSNNSSGDLKKQTTSSGSSLCRKCLWQWVFCRLEPRSRRLDNEVTRSLCTYLDQEKKSGKPIRLVRARVAARAVKLLFRELVKEIGQNSNTSHGC